MNILKKYKVWIGVLIVCLIVSAYGNCSLIRMKKKNDAIIKQLQDNIDSKSEAIIDKTKTINKLLANIQEKSSEILDLKNFKPQKVYIKVKDKDTVKANEYNKIVVDLDLCMVMNDDLMESVKRIKMTADIALVRFGELNVQMQEREADHTKLMKLVLDERDELYKRLSKRFFLVLGPSVSISTDGVFRFSLSLTYGKKII